MTVWRLGGSYLDRWCHRLYVEVQHVLLSTIFPDTRVKLKICVKGIVTDSGERPKQIHTPVSLPS